ncbi:MAG: hypothetical protein M3076_08015 [Actinomycetota bacterium]|nr:hypothetical protein [Actinomycetota bacterium]
MRSATQRRTSRMIGAIRETWAEYDYAQRRLLEINMGISLPPRRRSERVEELEVADGSEDPRISH